VPKNSKGERSVCNRKDQEWERLTDFAYWRPLRWEPDKFPSHMPSDITSELSQLPLANLSHTKRDHEGHQLASALGARVHQRKPGKAMGLKVKSKRRADGQRVFRVRP
jgi:hypothetical protein